METAVKEFNYDTFTEFDMQFHFKICEMSGNFVLMATYSMIRDILKYYIKESSRIGSAMANSLVHHKTLVKLLMEQKEAEAVSLMKKHIETVEAVLLESMKKTA
jgi:DNA-binding FadR family transcriptional regulator